MERQREVKMLLEEEQGLIDRLLVKHLGWHYSFSSALLESHGSYHVLASN